MKKLTKTQQEIERLAKRLPRPSEAFHKWDLRLRDKHNYSEDSEVYESFYSTIGKFSIERVFQVGKDYCDEVAQWWFDTETGKAYYRERHSSLIYGWNYGYKFQGYDPNSPFKFKPKSGMVDQYGYRFLMPYQRGGAHLTQILKRKGVTSSMVEKYGIGKVSKYLADPRMETIIKHSESDFDYLASRGLTDAVWSAYKIAIRHGYAIRNISIWYDLIEQMEFIGMDVRNPKYVCARDYKKLHDEVTERANRKRAREESERQRERRIKEMEKNKDLVEERMQKFGDLSISNGYLHSVLLVTIYDYEEEGTRMHHCVGGYFTHKDSIILSMRDKDGNRVETVEVDLRDFHIVQSRGVCNKSTKHHKEILDLVNANMWQIREMAEGKRMRVAC